MDLETWCVGWWFLWIYSFRDAFGTAEKKSSKLQIALSYTEYSLV
jgi:hypothetical protein